MSDIVNKEQLVKRPRAITHEKLLQQVEESLQRDGILTSPVVIELIIDRYLLGVVDCLKVKRKVDLNHIGRLYGTYRMNSRAYESKKFKDHIVPLIKVQSLDEELKDYLIKYINKNPEAWKRRK